jgi:hypothetical protein
MGHARRSPLCPSGTVRTKQNKESHALKLVRRDLITFPFTLPFLQPNSTYIQIYLSILSKEWVHLESTAAATPNLKSWDGATKG